MKSKINSLADYRQAPFEREVVISCPEEYMEKQLRRLTRGGKKTESVSVLQKGDVAVLTLESKLPKFNRPMVPVTVGGGLYDAELEAQLIGHAVGETFPASVQGESVTVTVKQANRTVFPEPTDAMAAAYAEGKEELNGITTVADYRKYVADSYCKDESEQVIFHTMEEIIAYVLTNSDWEFDPEELAALEAEIRQEIKEETDTEPDALTKGQMLGILGVGTREEMEQFIREEAERQIASQLWLAAAHGIDPETAVGEELYELQWDFLEMYVRDNLKIEIGG